MAKGSLTLFTCDTNPDDTDRYNGFTPTAVYVLGPSGEQMTEMTNSAGTWRWAHTNVYAPGLSATYDADPTEQTEGQLYFALSDWLGTRRQQTDYAGNPWLNFTSLPYGDGLTPVSISCLSPSEDATEHHYTGKERDTESGNDYFGARYYSSTMGRYLSPDWSKNPQGVPYADFTNPQTLNLYSYVKNNPLSAFDDDGHVTIEIRYNSLSYGYTHAYLVVTDTNGAQTYFRAGPSDTSPLKSNYWVYPASSGASSQTSGSQSSGSDSSNSSSPGSGPTADGDPWGALQAEHGTYGPGSTDWDSSPAASTTLLTNDQPADSYIDQLKQYEGSVNASDIPYNPLTTNSNAYATGAAGALGLTVPTPPVAAPGSNTKLPVVPLPPPPKPPAPPPCSVAGACPN